MNCLIRESEKEEGELTLAWARRWHFATSRDL